MRRATTASLAALTAGCLLAAAPAAAADLRLAAGTTGAGTSWRGDGAVWAQGQLAVRFADLIGPFAGLDVGYGTVDQRVLTLVTIGAQVWGRLGPVRPYLRLGFAHQHEESVSVVAGNIGKALLGIGDAIRHRGGLIASAGADIPLLRLGSWRFYGAVEATLRWFPDQLGPPIYAGGGLFLGAAYGI